MADQPTFKDTPQIQPTGAVGSFSSFSSANKNIDDFFNTVGQATRRVALDSANTKGKEEGFKPDYSPKAHPITPFAIAEREAAIQSHQAVISTDISTSMQGIETKWTTPKSNINPDGGISPDSLKNYQTEASHWSQGYFSTMPKVFQGNAKLQLASKLSAGQARIFRQTSTLQSNNQLADLKADAAQRLTSANNDLFSGNEAAGTMKFAKVNEEWK